MTTPRGLTFTMATLSSPNPPALARFYARLLGWEIETEEPGWVTLRNPAGWVAQCRPPRRLSLDLPSQEPRVEARQRRWVW